MLNKKSFTELIRQSKFRELFNELGWDNVRKRELISTNDEIFELNAVAAKCDFLIFVCSHDKHGKIPDKNTRKKIDNKIAKLYFEHLIIYCDKTNHQQVWQLVIRQPNKPIVVRETPYFQTQYPELLFQRLSGLFFSIEDEDKISIVDVKSSILDQFNTNAEKVTKKFYTEFKTQHTSFLKFLKGIESKVDQEWYASLMLNRLMFIYFIQKKGFLDRDPNYLKNKLDQSRSKMGKDKFYKSFYRNFLLTLFHKGLGNPDRPNELIAEIGKIPYLNGGLFDIHELESKYTDIQIDDKAFEKIFDFFDEYNWHLDTKIDASGKDINPDVIGYIFEKYINDRASMGAYYTKEDITEYISKNTIIPSLFDMVKKNCANAFEFESSLWKMLKDDPDRYIYESTRKGAKFELPDYIEIGIDTTTPNLIERRKEWNKPAQEEFALPTEIWREVVERRTRYYDLKKKLKNNEILVINDFITYNLDIRQFAQDAIYNYEGSDFINSFYKAIENIKILDPTCGSGAFLFAALNILEPLYETCIQRMSGFIEEDDIHSGKKHSQFRKILADIEKHPSQRYYIYKSIILNNLYGVDMMNEAVEIAKLRLFLKLVAEVEPDYKKENMGLEPLPDIDFNIRFGNSLIGYATINELNKGLSWDLDFESNKDKISKQIFDQLDLVALVFKGFKAIQLNDNKIDYKKYKVAKDELNKRLSELNNSLNEYLANDYGLVKKKELKKYLKWYDTHKPFHWFAEYYEILNERHGFDVIIGNPPYVEYNKINDLYKIRNFKTENCGNLYAFVMERANQLLKEHGKLSMIIPLASFSTNRMLPLQKIFIENGQNLYLSNYEATSNPSTLFIGVKIQLSILIWEKITNSKSKIFTTKYLRSYAIERPYLFFNLCYTNGIYNNNNLLRCNNPLEKFIFDKIISNSRKTNSIKGTHPIYFRNMGNFFFKLAFEKEPQYYKNGELENSSTVSYLLVKKDIYSKIIAIINSSLFYYYWVTHSDCYHLSKNDILNYPFPNDIFINVNGEELLILEKEYLKSIEKNSIWQLEEKTDGTSKKYRRYFPQSSKYISDKIDFIISQMYNFSDQEIDFIINYDIKYRMGKELAEDQYNIQN